MKKKFGDWLNDTLIERGLKPADLTQLSRGKLDSGVLSNHINNKRKSPAFDTCKIIADALQIPLQEVYIAAGYLPENTELDTYTATVSTIMKELQPDDKKDILEYARLRHKLARNRDDIKVTSKRSIRGTVPT